MKKVLLFVSVLAALTVSASCSKINDDDNSKKTVAVFLPSGELNPKWAEDASLLESSIARYGYKVKVYTASDDSKGADIQVNQLKEAINGGISYIVITPIDDKKITSSGILSGKKDLDVICYDRMIRDCDAVDYYVGCSHTSIGNMQGQFILQYFKASGKTPMSIELFAGPSSDDNSRFFFEGADKLLAPYINNGYLTVPSGKTSFAEVSLPTWNFEDAKAEMAARLNASGIVPDFILATNDVVADGAIQAIKDYGYKGSFPVITGLDNIETARLNILAGYQTMTIDKDLVPLADNTAMVVNSVLSGSPIQTSFSLNNGAKDIPAFYSSISLITIDNLK